MDPFVEAVHELRRHWFWFFLLGVLLIVLGMVALSSEVFVALIAMVFYGCLLITAGLFQGVAAFWGRRWHGFFMHLLAAALDLVVGFMLVTRPEAAATALTLLLAIYFMVGGLFRIISAVAIRQPQWGWSLLAGVVTLGLGLAIFNSWPDSGPWVIGLFIGIDMIFHGWSWVMLALAARRLPEPTAMATPTA
jgi:uncharacterized membrane protein HdeD (DUF308 family)